MSHCLTAAITSTQRTKVAVFDCSRKAMRTVHEVLPLRVSVPRETGVIGRTLVLRLPEQEPKGVIRLLNLGGSPWRECCKHDLGSWRREG